MFYSIKVRLYPTIKQKQMLDNHFNAYRYCYNLCLEYRSLLWREYKISKSGIDMQNELFEIRKTTPWLLKCKAECIREAALKTEQSIKKFFSGNNYPNFKSKKDKQSFYAHQNIKIKGRKISFFGHLLNFKSSESHIKLLKSTHINTITFTRDSTGNYFASCLIENSCYTPIAIAHNTVGIDLGLKDLIITSDGIKYPNNRYLRSTSNKIIKLQRRFSRSQKSSQNRNKLRAKIAKLYIKATRQREHYYHQVINELIRDNQTIVIESLKVSNMIKNHNLARSISDASWSTLTSILEYKAHWNRRNIIKLDTFYPSTKTCSNCGSIKDMPLKKRFYNCKCGLSLDRDINAAINIRNAGLKIPGVLMEGVGYEPVEVRSNNLIINN